MSRLVLFPRRNGKTKQGDASAADVKAAKGEGASVARRTTQVLPIINDKGVSEANVAEEKEKGEEDAYRKLRIARSDAKLIGVREKRAKLKAEEAAATKK